MLYLAVEIEGEGGVWVLGQCPPTGRHPQARILLSIPHTLQPREDTSMSQLSTWKTGPPTRRPLSVRWAGFLMVIPMGNYKQTSNIQSRRTAGRAEPS